MIYTDDNREYTKIIEHWISRYLNTGFIAPGIKIKFEEYAEDAYGNIDYNSELYSLFIHKDSLILTEYPLHDTMCGITISRPDEEVTIYVWYNVEDDTIRIIPFEDNHCTNLNRNFVMGLIRSINDLHYSGVN